jgi:hypothetical protein
MVRYLSSLVAVFVHPRLTHFKCSKLVALLVSTKDVVSSSPEFCSMYWVSWHIGMSHECATVASSDRSCIQRSPPEAAGAVDRPHLSHSYVHPKRDSRRISSTDLGRTAFIPRSG